MTVKQITAILRQPIFYDETEARFWEMELVKLERKESDQKEKPNR